MRSLMIAIALLAAGPAGAETVYATRAMNPKGDGFTPGVVRAGSREANTGVQPKCQTVTANFGYADGRVVRETKTRCD